MQKFLFLPLLLSLTICLSLSLSAQSDTTQPTLKQQVSVPEIEEAIPFNYGGCAHGHICCAVGCRCCPELSRPQKFKESKYNAGGGVKRTLFAEKYAIAASHEKSPIFYQFSNKGLKSNQKYYNAAVSKFAGVSLGVWGDLSKEQLKRAETFGPEGKLVFDDHYDFFLIDGAGNRVPMTYHSRIQIGPDLYRVSILLNQTRIWGLADENGNAVGPLSFRYPFTFDEAGCAIVEDLNRKQGLINQAGELVIGIEARDIDRVGPGRYLTADKKGVELRDEKGKILTHRKYERFSEYSEGRAFAKRGEKGVFIDMNGREVMTLKWDWAKGFHDGMAAFNEDGKWGFINREGEVVIEAQYDWVLDFHDGMAAVAIGENSNRQEWSLINKKGKPITNAKFTRVVVLKGGMAMTVINGQGEGLVRSNGRKFMACKFDFEPYTDPETWFVHGLLIRREIGKENSLEAIDEKGKKVLDLSEYAAARFEALAHPKRHCPPLIRVYRKGDLSNYVDLKGNKLLNHFYKPLFLLNDSTAFGTRSEKNYLIDVRTGKEVFAWQKGVLRKWDDGIYTLEYPKYQYRYFRRDGEEVTPFAR